MALKESLQTLKNGDCLALFPEGTRNGIAKGEKVKDGAAFFAVRSGAPVIPCGIKGGEKGNIKVVNTYGKPLDFCWFLQSALVLSTRLVAYAVQQTNILLPIKPGTGGNFVLLNLGINGN